MTFEPMNVTGKSACAAPANVSLGAAGDKRMIYHLSIAAHHPKRVAEVFAELLDGISLPFPPAPGAYLALTRDGHGTAVEVYPADVVLAPNGLEGARFDHTGRDEGLTPVHFALSVDVDVADVEAIARREDWMIEVCSRGGDFDVIELWVENRFLVELLPPAFAARYLAFAERVASANAPSALMASHAR